VCIEGKNFKANRILVFWMKLKGNQKEFIPNGKANQGEKCEPSPGQSQHEKKKDVDDNRNRNQKRK
jgi:hypothetical protein